MSRGEPSTKSFAALLYVLVAVGIAVPIYSAGAALAIHAVCLLTAPLLMAFSFRDPLLRILWVVCGLWAGAQFFSDLVHGTQLGSMPTIIPIAVALLATFLVWIVRAGNVNPASLLIAIAIGWIVLEIVTGTAAERGNVWKYGLSYPVALLVLAIAQRANARRSVYALLLLGLAAFSVVNDARFSAGLFLVAGTLAILLRQAREGGKPRSRAVIIVVLLAVILLYFAYPSVALSGALGERAYLQQVRYQAEGANFLLATRMEFPHTAALFAQYPWLGIGAFGVISGNASEVALQFVNNVVVNLQPSDIRYLTNASRGGEGYYAHSAALASMLYAGFLATPFWIYLTVRNFKAIVMAVRGVDYFAVPAILLVGLTAWDMLFSPLTNKSHVSISIAFFVFWVLHDRGVRLLQDAVKTDPSVSEYPQVRYMSREQRARAREDR